MKREEIVIEIGPKGEVSADVTCGPGGAGCMAELDKLLGQLGNKTVENKKPEAFRAVVVGRAGAGVKR